MIFDVGVGSRTLPQSYITEDEYKMQETWRDSVDKCTFIVLDKDLLESYALTERDTIDSMVGDTNLFISTDDDNKKVINELLLLLTLIR